MANLSGFKKELPNKYSTQTERSPRPDLVSAHSFCSPLPFKAIPPTLLTR